MHWKPRRGPRSARRQRASRRTARPLLRPQCPGRRAFGSPSRKNAAQAGQGALAARRLKAVPRLRRTPCDAHHLRFAEPRALGRKVSDEFTVPLCRTHHRQVHDQERRERVVGGGDDQPDAGCAGEPEARRRDSAKRTARQRSCDSLTRLSSEQMLSCAVGTPMSAFIIRYIERTQAGSDDARALLAHRIEGLWNTPLQFEDTWLIQSNETSDHIRDQLTELVPDGDALIVIAATQDAAWAGLGPIESEWLIDHI